MECDDTKAVEVFIIEEVNKGWWNDLVKSVPSGNVYQTTYWADFHKEEYGIKPAYALIFKKGILCGICLIFKERKYHVLLHEKKLRFILRLMPFTHRIQNGPVLFDEDKEIMKEFSEQIKKKLKRFYCIHPNIFDKEQKYLGFRFKKEGTYLLKLNDYEIVWNALKGKTRKDIKYAQRKGWKFFITEDIESFGKEYEKYRKENKLFPLYSGSYFKNIKKHLKNKIVIFGVENNGIPISYMCLRVFNGIASECYSIRNKCGDLLSWNMIKWCCANGISTYDLCGFNPENQTEKEEHIKSFKKKWGGEEVVYKRFHS